MAATFGAVLACPVFLLLDPVAVWTEADSNGQRCLRLASYILTPHRYVAKCLANHFRGRRGRLFSVLARVQVAADLFSCVALGRLLNRPGSTPAAMLAGCAITVIGFIGFFGPTAVVANFNAAFDGTKSCWRRLWRGMLGSFIGVVLLYTVIWYMLLIAGQNPTCPLPGFPAGCTFSAPNCSGHGVCASGGSGCACELGYGPQVLDYSSTLAVAIQSFDDDSQPSFCNGVVQPCTTINRPACGANLGNNISRHCESGAKLPCVCDDGSIGHGCGLAYTVSGAAMGWALQLPSVFGVYVQSDGMFAGSPVFLKLAFRPATATVARLSSSSDQSYCTLPVCNSWVLHRSNVTHCSPMIQVRRNVVDGKRVRATPRSTGWAIDNLYFSPGDTMAEAVATVLHRIAVESHQVDNYYCTVPMLSSGPGCQVSPDGCSDRWQEGGNPNPSVNVKELVVH